MDSCGGIGSLTYRARVSSVDNAQIHQNTTVDLPLAKDSLRRPLVEAIHLSLTTVLGEACDEDLPLLVAQEGCSLGPVCGEELACCAYDNRDQPFDYEDPGFVHQLCSSRVDTQGRKRGAGRSRLPSPSIISAHAAHVGDGVCQKPRDSAGYDACREEQGESPLELEPRIVHGDQIYASLLVC